MPKCPKRKEAQGVPGLLVLWVLGRPYWLFFGRKKTSAGNQSRISVCSAHPLGEPARRYVHSLTGRERRSCFSAAASGAVCQWQTSSTDRRGSGDRPLGNVPPGRSGPKGRAKYVRRKKFAQSLVSPPPLGGAGAQWAPFSAWSPLPRRSVMDAAHWAASPESADEKGAGPPRS